MLIIYKKHKKQILALSLVYGVILSFPAFGPILNNIVGIESGVLYGSIFLFALLTAFVIKPVSFEKNNNYLRILLTITILSILSFSYVGNFQKYINIIIIGICLGRYAVLWSYSFVYNIRNDEIACFIALVLLISYSILYVSNVFVPDMIPVFGTVWVAVLLMIPLIYYSNLDICFLQFVNVNYKALGKYYEILIVIFLIYLTAGVTYAGVYIDLKVYQALERYYNVLPFLAIILTVGWLVKKWGRDFLLYGAICCLGIAFVFTFLPSGIMTYMLTQTTLQIGWALMDAFVWIVGAYAAYKHKNPMILPIFVAVFLFGTFVGSLITTTMRVNMQTQSKFVFNFITQVPLFLTLIILGLRQNKNDIIVEADRASNIQDNEEFEELTAREKEVVELLMQDYTYRKISEVLYISPNTLKTHARHIYKKLDVNNKKELIEYFKSKKTHNS